MEMQLDKVFLDSARLKDIEQKRFACKSCELLQIDNRLRFFAINTDTEIFKCEGPTCMFPFKKFIFRNRKDHRLYTVQEAASAVPAGTSRRMSLDIESYIMNIARQSDGVKESDVDDLFKDLFSDVKQEQSAHVPAILANENPPPREQFTKVPLITSLLQDLEQKRYRCKSCERFNMESYLRFFFINHNTELFKCESRTCMFPFRNFIFRDRSNQSVYTYKSVKPPEVPVEYAPGDLLAEFVFEEGVQVETEEHPSKTSSNIEDILNELFPSSGGEECSETGISPAHSPAKKMKVEKSDTEIPLVLSNRTWDIMKRKKPAAPLNSVQLKKIPSPLDLVTRLLNTKTLENFASVEEALPFAGERMQLQMWKAPAIIKKVPKRTTVTRKPVQKGIEMRKPRKSVKQVEVNNELPCLDADEELLLPAPPIQSIPSSQSKDRLKINILSYQVLTPGERTLSSIEPVKKGDEEILAPPATIPRRRKTGPGRRNILSDIIKSDKLPEQIPVAIVRPSLNHRPQRVRKPTLMISPEKKEDKKTRKRSPIKKFAEKIKRAKKEASTVN